VTHDDLRTGPQPTSTHGEDHLLADLLAERFPHPDLVRTEANQPIPAPTLIRRGNTAVTIDTMRQAAQDLAWFRTRQLAASTRRTDARIAAARKITAAARRKTAS
jgi:hypothetical protein